MSWQGRRALTDQQERTRFEAEFARTDASTDPFVSAVRATRMPMLITDPHQPDNPIVFVNAAFSKLTGYRHDEIIGRNCRFLQGAETNKADIAKIRAAIARRVPIEIELLNHKKSGEVFWNRLLISPVFDRDGELTYFFASQFDVTLEREKLARMQRDREALEREVERRTGDLTRSEERLRFILKAGRFGSWTLDLADMRLVASDACKENFGRAPGEPFSYEDLIAAIDPDNLDWQRDLMVSNNKVANAKVQTGDFAGGKARFEEGLKIARRLFARDPASVTTQTDLIICLTQVAIGENEDLARKGALIDEALGMMEKLSDAGQLPLPMNVMRGLLEKLRKDLGGLTQPPPEAQAAPPSAPVASPPPSGTPAQ